MSLDLCDSVAEICAGCLSTDRRLEQLTGEAESYFSAIVCSVEVHIAPCSVCWECGAELRRALRLRARVAAAQHSLRLYALGQTSLPHSLSNLSLHKTESVDISHDTDKQSDGQSRTDESRPLFIKMETRDEDDDFDGLYVDEGVAERSVDMIDDTDLKAVLKQDATELEIPLKKSTRTKIEEGFDASDDEPLTLKKGKKREGKKRGRKKKTENGDIENIAPKAEKRGRQEKPAGVVHNARVARRLELLNVPPGALEMIVLTWEEVEAERQRALLSPQYTRHEHRCGDCAVGFNHRAKLQQHMLKHSPSSGDLECSACHIRSRDQHSLAAHRRRHRVRWRCSTCGALWSRAAVAADHRARAHVPARAPTHVCTTCGHVASTLGKLRSHLKDHAERQRCELCGKTFRDRASLRTHLFIHRGEKEHVCPRCDKRFLFKKALQLHQLTHDQPAHLYCHQCDVTFKNRMSYYQHMKYNLKHIDPEKLKYACTMCDKRFAKAVRLAEHRAAVHLKTRPVRCTQPDCSFACASRPVLRAHVRGAHRGMRARRDHVCHRCGKAYTTKKTLEGHLRSHSGERPFLCTICNASFGYHAALYNHTRLVHLKNKPARSQAAAAPAPWPPRPPPGAAHNDVDVT